LGLSLLMAAGCAAAASGSGSGSGSGSDSDNKPVDSGARNPVDGGLPFAMKCAAGNECESGVCIARAGGTFLLDQMPNRERVPERYELGLLNTTRVGLTACGCTPDAQEEICGDGIDNDCDGVVDCGASRDASARARADAGHAKPADAGRDSGFERAQVDDRRRRRSLRRRSVAVRPLCHRPRLRRRHRVHGR